jgi:hypothetical protein
MAIELIFCADGNRRFAEIAQEHGFKYGARLPHRGLHFPIYFADQDWKHPDRGLYMNALAEYRPRMASVLDWERPEQFDEVMSWAEEAAQWVEIVVVIPKVSGMIGRIPRAIGKATVRLGYSVPTRYGGTSVPIWEFGAWPVHLLGGSPQAQIRLANYLHVASADGNMHLLMANKFCAFFDPQKRTRHGYWPTLSESDRQRWPGDDAHYEAFRRSCINIMAAWQLHSKISVEEDFRL